MFRKATAKGCNAYLDIKATTKGCKAYLGIKATTKGCKAYLDIWASLSPPSAAPPPRSENILRNAVRAPVPICFRLWHHRGEEG
jgi:hypothetical protein